MFFIGISIQSQTISKSFQTLKLSIKKDTVYFDSVPINSQKFKIFDTKKRTISTSEYQIDFTKSLLIIDSKKYPKIILEYYLFPDFITKIYAPFNEKLIVPNATETGKLYSFTTTKELVEVNLFEGLKTSGFITRGITSGTNQNAVTNSGLDLEISGKLSKRINLKANIFDTNIPLQENGYSQNITDFDRIFIEMFTENWSVKAGDVSLQNKESYFLNFNKQISGIQVNANLNEDLKVGVSGAIVRGKFRSVNFTGIEGNQGPYKLYGVNNEPGIIVIAGSETVYVNGIALPKGENNAYSIDYNLAEVSFNTTFPITNDMRIVVEFQYSDRNYTRFLTYEEVKYQKEKFNISSYFYSESDAKNQPIQQNLTTNQQQILTDAGDNQSKMVANSAFLDSYSESKIVYKKTQIGMVDVFEHSTNSNDELYSVTFTNVGQNNGNYSIDKSVATGTIYKFVGVNLGSFSPVIRLVAPTKSEIFVVKSAYNPSRKTTIGAEIAISTNDANLFSSKDDAQKSALGAIINWEQILVDKKWQLKSKINHEFVQQNFNTEQGWEPVEFNRDWNILTNNATKSFFQSEISLENKEEDFIKYRFKNLEYMDVFNGNKHEFSSKISKNNTSFNANGSYLENTSTLEENSFLRLNLNIEHRFKKMWVGGKIDLETNERKHKTSKNLINLSHRFKEYETYFGVGDTTQVFAKIGVKYRNNDSIKLNQFTEINNRKTIYFNSKLIHHKNTNLAVFANYRSTENTFKNNEKSLNSRISFTQKLFKNFVSFGISYETSSGNIARQDYVYFKTEPGQGFYTWIDYNNDEVQDFNEFEIAQFQDQANYLRIPKPNLSYIPTQRVKWNQNLAINFKQWQQKKGLKKALSHFDNQTFLSVENEVERTQNLVHFNPFNLEDSKILGLNFSFRNSLYFNRNLQDFSLIYTFGNSKNKQQYFIGNQENSNKIHQFEIHHKFSDFWVFDFMGKTSKNNLTTENFINRNYKINSFEFQPKINFLYHKNNRFTAFYHFKNKENRVASFEQLKQQKIGVEYFYLNEKGNQISANITAFLNDFEGNTNTPVAYQMLEGLQSGKNFTWDILFNKKLNSFLTLNISYLGRKSENYETIHTGSVLLKAVF